MHHETYMSRCLQLAELGGGAVAPNPMVGAVLVHEEKIIGEGYHQKYGEAHAEVNCLKSVLPENRPMVQESTMYISLEPCAHFGKTPPCADLILKHKIPEVVVACRDTFTEVNGRGVERLQKAGTSVTVGILEKEARELNRRFFTFHEKKRPYIILKWAQSADGFIAKENFERIAISNELTNRFTHSMRAQEAAIMVGTNTALHDNPSLTTRLWKGNNPVRVVIDKNLNCSRSAPFYNSDAKTIILNGQKNAIENNIEFFLLEPGVELAEQLPKLLFERNLSSIIIEGGRALLQYFFELVLWDEAVVITNKTIHSKTGISAPTLKTGNLHDQFNFGTDDIRIFKNPPFH